MTYDYYFKQLIKSLTYDRAISGYSIGTFEKAIDIIIRPKHTTEQTTFKYLPDIFNTPKTHHVIEFKSEADRCIEADLYKTALYKWGYCYSEKIKADELENIKASLILVNKPKWLKERIREGRIRPFRHKGIYIPLPLSIDYIIVINELSVNEQNLGLLMNSTGKKLSQTLRYIKEKRLLNVPNLSKYILLKCVIIMGKEDEDLMTEVKEVIGHEFDKAIENALKFFGLEKVIDVAGLEKVIDVVGLEKVIDAIGLEKVIEKIGWDRILKTIKDDDKIIKSLITYIGKERLRKLLEEK